MGGLGYCKVGLCLLFSVNRLHILPPVEMPWSDWLKMIAL
jgi:hypothetical protein